MRTSLMFVGVAAGFTAILGRPALSDYSLDFTMVNDTNRPIVAMWASVTAADSWGNRMTNLFVPAGGKQLIKFNSGASGSGCDYDIKMQFSTGTVRTISNINLCTVRFITIDVNDDGKVTYDLAE